MLLLEDRDLRYRFDHVWFNGYVHSKAGGNVFGPIDGERLTRRICEVAIPECIISGSNIAGGRGTDRGAEGWRATQVPACRRATIYLLSPSGRSLADGNGLGKIQTEAHLVPGAGVERESRAPKSYNKSVAMLPEALTEAELEKLAKSTPSDNSAANGLSPDYS